MGEWMETAVNILMLFTTGTAVLFVIMYILAKNPETKAAVRQWEDSLIIAAIMSIVLSLVTMNIFIIYDEMDFLMQISEYTKLVISVLFFEYLIADPKPGKLFCRHRWRRAGFEEKLEHGISYSMCTYECTKCDKVMTVDGRFDKVQKKAYHERPGRRESSDDDRIGKVNIQSLRNRLLLLGSAAVKDFTGREAAGTRRQDINYLLDDAIRKMSPEQLKHFIKKNTAVISARPGPITFIQGRMTRETAHGATVWLITGEHRWPIPVQSSSCTRISACSAVSRTGPKCPDSL